MVVRESHTLHPDLADPDKALALLDDPDVIVDDFQDAIKVSFWYNFIIL